MKFTKRTLSALLALAVVFSTLVFVSVGASVDFPIHNTYVTLSGGKTQNCKQNVPMYEASGKIGYANSEEFTVDAWFQSSASRLSELVSESEAMGEYVCIDLYAEFVSELKNTRLAASVNFGAGDVLPQAKNTNVANPTSDHAVDFVNNKIVTLKLWIDDIVQVGTVDKINQVMITVYPELKDKVTGTFFYSAPYIPAKDGENLSTVNITSIKTTTTKADEAYSGAITCYDSGVTFAGSHEAAKAQWGTKNECFVYYGNYAGYENKYVHIDGSGKQMQVINMTMNGLEQIRQRAIAADKSICIDIYANNFTNGGHKNAKCDTFMNFGAGQIGGDAQNERIVIKSGIKQTIVFSADKIKENGTKWNLTFQNYSYGDYANITDAKFIVTAPYVEGDAPLAPITPSTTERPTKPENETWDGETLVTYNNGVQYSGKPSWSNLTNGKVEAGITTLSTGETVKNYVHVDSSPRQQMQSGPIPVTGLGALIEKAKDNEERMFIDLYAKGTNSAAYFFVSLGGFTSGAMDCQIYNNKKHTLELDVDRMSASSASSIAITMQNYSFSPYTIGGNFVVSVPYLESDMKETAIPNVSTSTTTTTTASTTPKPTIDINEEGDLPLKVPESTVKYTGGWGNPEAFYLTSEGKVSYLNVFSSYGNQLQMLGYASGLPALMVQAAEEGKNVCIDFYGNFLTKAGTAKIRANVGNGIWYGAASRTDNPDKTDINGDKMLTIKQKEVTTLKINPQKMFDYLRSTSTTVKVDKSEKQVESLSYTGDLKPTTFTQNDIEPKSAKLHQFDNVKKNDYIEYVIPSVKASTYNIKLNTRDLQSSGEFAVYINDTLVDTIDFNANTKTYNTRDLGDFTFDKDGDVKVKLVSKGNYDGTALMLDSIKVTDLLEEETTTVAPNSNEELAKKCTQVAVAIWGNGSWGGDWSTTGRFYMTVPYIEGAEMGAPVQGITTTTTQTKPSQKPAYDFTSIDKVDLGYVDCKFDAADWNANGSTGTRVQNNKVYKFGVSGDKAQQIGAQLNLNGGSITKPFNNTDENVWDYVQYAREAGAWLAMDVYPSFGMSDGGSLYVHMNTSWVTTKSSDETFEFEDLLADSASNSELYVDDTEDANTYAKYTEVKVDDEIIYTVSGLNAANYKIAVPAMLSPNGAEFQVYVNEQKFSKVTFNASEEKRSSVTLVDTYKLAQSGDVTIKLVCTKAGELTIDKVNFTEGNFTWPKNIKEFKINAGKRYTYYIDPFDIPTGSSKFSVYFDSYEYAPGWRAIQGAEIFLTAPYLVNVKNPDKTTTSTVVTTTSTQPTTVPPTYAYPSNNGGGKTRFTVGDVKCGPRAVANVPISISNNEGLYNAKFSIKFNPQKLQYEECTNGDVFENIDINEDEKTDGIIHITLYQDSSDTTLNGVVANLKFRSLDRNTGNYYPISFAGSGYIPANFFNFEGEKVACSFRTGYVIVDSEDGTVTRPADHDALKPYPENNGSTTFTIETVEGVYSADEEFEVGISLSGNVGISSAKFTIAYDTDKLQFVGSSVAPTMPPVFNLVDYNFDPIEYDKGILTYDICPKDGRNIVDSNRSGKLIVMKFKLLTDEPGTYSIAFGGESYDAKNYKDALNENVSCSFKSGAIVVKESATVVTTPSSTSSTTNTTKAPTTVVPTTKAPTTVAPTTKAPTTVAPTTKAPTTVAPTTTTTAEASTTAPVVTKPVAPVVLAKLTSKTSATISWQSVSGAVNYQVFRAVGNSNSFVMIAANVIGTSYKDNAIKGGNTYKYKVVVKSAGAESESNVAAITVMNFSKKPVIKSLKPSKKKMKVQIKTKDTGVAGFQIQVSTNKKFKKKLTKSATTTSLTKTFKKLKSGKKYFVKARAYSVINGKKVYGKWSKVKYKKVK